MEEYYLMETPYTISDNVKPVEMSEFPIKSIEFNNINRFERLSGGNDGEVFLLVNNSTPYAVKRFKRGLSTNFWEFYNEIESDTTKEDILYWDKVKPIGKFQQGSIIYLVFTYIQCDLSNSVKKSGIYRFKQWVKYIHSKGWLHLDISMRNVLIEDGIPYLIDYSLVSKINQLVLMATPIDVTSNNIRNKRLVKITDDNLGYNMIIDRLHDMNIIHDLEYYKIPRNSFNCLNSNVILSMIILNIELWCVTFTDNYLDVWWKSVIVNTIILIISVFMILCYIYKVNACFKITLIYLYLSWMVLYSLCLKWMSQYSSVDFVVGISVFLIIMMNVCCICNIKIVRQYLNNEE